MNTSLYPSPKAFVAFICFILLIVTFSINISAQKQHHHKYFNDITYDYGMLAPMIKNNRVPIDIGQVHRLTFSNFFTEKLGAQTGLQYAHNIFKESDGQLSVPLYFTSRTHISSRVGLNHSPSSVQDMLFQILFNLFPRDVEFSIGPNLGCVLSTSKPTADFLPENTNAYRYAVKNRFFTSLDANLDMSYQIWRIGLHLSPGLSYALTNNYVFESNNPTHPEIGLIPKWFFRGSFGLSYSF